MQSGIVQKVHLPPSHCQQSSWLLQTQAQHRWKRISYLNALLQQHHKRLVPGSDLPLSGISATVIIGTLTTATKMANMSSHLNSNADFLQYAPVGCHKISIRLEYQV